MFDSDFGGLKDIDGIGETVIESLRDWENGNLPLICSGKDVEYLASFFEFEKSKTGDRLKGMTFVITGSLQYYENRNAMVVVIESLGGKVSGSVSSKTTALINNDVNSDPYYFRGRFCSGIYGIKSQEENHYGYLHD